tara:strand:+ start:1113 stop:1463 length:351 start_codon:yes stop_codon:yes gene_type:complete
MFRKHFYYLLALFLLSLVIYFLEKFDVLKFHLSIFPLLISAFTFFTMGQYKKRKKQILLVKVIFFLNIIYLLKYIIFDNTALSGFIYLAIVTILLAFALNSLKKDQELVDSSDRLR